MLNYKYLIAERSSPSVGLNLKCTTHTKGHYGIEEPELKFRKKGMQEDSYEKDKSPKAEKVLKWHGNAEQMNMSVCYLIQSCRVRAISYLKTKVIMKLIFWPQQSYLDLKILVSTLPYWTFIND